MASSNHLITSREYCGNFYRNIYQMSDELEDAVSHKRPVKALQCGVSIKEYETLKKVKPYTKDKATRFLLSYNG